MINRNNPPNEIKQKTLAMELISHILAQHKFTLLANKDFLDLIKHNLTESLLKNCVSTDQLLMSISFAIFINLVNNLHDIKNNLKFNVLLSISIDSPDAKRGQYSGTD